MCSGLDMRRLVPLLLAALGLVGGLALARGRTAPEADITRETAPLTRVVAVARRDVQLAVRAHGTVEPRTESDLVPEVSGRVVWVSPALAAGGFFDAGATLLEIDPRDYQSALRRAEAGLERARSQLELAHANLARLRTLRGHGVGSESGLDEVENAARVAEAARVEAEAARDDALRGLERTRLIAPYAGRVRQESVDVGQLVGPGQPIARLYAIDYAEVRLPIRDAQLAQLELSLDHAESGDAAGAGPAVVLRAPFAGAEREWRGTIVRTGGEIDPKSRTLQLVARVDDPYGRAQARGRTPLAVGLFVDAEIAGRTLEDVIALPHSALRESHRIFALDADSRLRIHSVQLIHAQGEQMLVRAPLEEGTLVCLSELPGAREGMRVRPLIEDPP
jgi:RND family efflux transporter MFP subunit